MCETKQPSKHIWFFYLAGMSCAAFGIWQGYQFGKTPGNADLDLAMSFTGVAACWAIVAIGKGKL